MSGQQDVVAGRAREYFDSGSAIRRMFTEGLRLSARYGPENVADMSLGNPTFDPPDEFVDAIWRIAHEGGPHSYMPNAGYPEVRARVAANLEEYITSSLDALKRRTIDSLLRKRYDRIRHLGSFYEDPAGVKKAKPGKKAGGARRISTRSSRLTGGVPRAGKVPT